MQSIIKHSLAKLCSINHIYNTNIQIYSKFLARIQKTITYLSPHLPILINISLLSKILLKLHKLIPMKKHPLCHHEQTPRGRNSLIEYHHKTSRLILIYHLRISFTIFSMKESKLSAIFSCLITLEPCAQVKIPFGM